MARHACSKVEDPPHRLLLLVSHTHTARVTVHFITVSEKFAPCDVVLAISTPDELSDAALASACTLHTAAPSSSSSSGSSRQQKLSWIQEAIEEGSQLNGEDNTVTRPATAKSSHIPTILEPATTAEEEPVRTNSVISQTSESVPIILDHTLHEPLPTPDIPHVTVEPVADAPTTPDADLSELQETLKTYDKLFEGGPEPRNSTQTARPNYDELYEHYYAQYSKPKVKLGPRPRPSLDSKRPSTSGSSSHDVARPKSSLPPGLRSGTRKATERKASKTSESSAVPTIAIPPPPPIPSTPEMPLSPVLTAFTSRSPASVKSMPVSTYSSHIRATGMTQEKSRLMKALELRKKQQKAMVEKQAKKAEDAAAAAQASTDIETEIKVEEPTVEHAKAQPDVATDSEESLPITQEKQDMSSGEDTSFGDDLASSLGLTSSSAVFTGSQADTDDLNSSVSVSSPISAQTQGSSGAPSTRPSSISEDELSAIHESQKPREHQEPQTLDLVDEEQSVNSTPTVVPETRTPVLSVELSSPSSQPAPIENTLPDPFVQQEPQSTSLLAAEDNARSRRRSARESMIYVPSIDISQPEDAQMKRRNRESVIMPSSKRQSWYESKEKRRAMLDPLQVSAENSEAEYLSDDSFMEELQSATVLEAKPMVVSKSPITPLFSRKSTAELPISKRSISQPYQIVGRPSPESIRTTSGAWPPRSNTDTVVTAKKINVSSGISQRIKALAEKSNRESVSQVSPNALNTPSSTLAQRKSSFFATSPAETSPSGRPVSRLGSPNFLNKSATTTPEKKPKPIKATVYNIQREAEKPESVQVTARIVRDERTMKPTLAMPTEGTPLDLHASPLIIDHQKPTWTPKSPTRGRQEPASPRAPSSHSREQSNSRTSSESTWRSFGRRMSETKSIHTLDGDEKQDKKDKKESRTSKMFKRMSSSISAMPWKNSSNNLTLPEHEIRSTSLSSLREPPPPVQIGDLNIQFPDTLVGSLCTSFLWKILT